MKKKSEIIRFVKFFFFSISAGLIEIVSFAFLDGLTNFNYSFKYIVALVLSVLWNFTLNRNFTFKSASNVPIAMFKVLIYYLIFTPVSTYLGNLLVAIGITEIIVLVMNMVLNFVTEFLYQKYYVFKNSIDTK